MSLQAYAIFNKCKLGVYPFHDGKYEDFEQVFESLIKVSRFYWKREEF